MGQGVSDLEICVSEDRLTVLVNGIVTKGNLSALPSGIISQLKEMGVDPLPSINEITMQLVQAAKDNPHISNLAVASGIPPRATRDGKIEWAEDFFATGYHIDEKTGTADYYRPRGRPIVERGQLLATLIPPRKGIAGVDVFGAEIAVTEPEVVAARAGNNVSVEHEGEYARFFADSAGRVTWDSDTVSVEEVFIVDGNVGLATGHIDYPKRVVIRGDVLDGSRIRAGDSVEIGGTVEDSDIHTSGDLVIAGGVIGSAEGSVYAKGRIDAKFIIDVTVESHGDIAVTNEITNAVVKTIGSVSVPKGRIVGGEIIALGGIEVGEAGSGGHQPTMLIAAENYTILSELEPLRTRLASMRKVYGVIRGKLSKFPTQRTQRPEKMQEDYLGFVEKAAKIAAALKQLCAEIDALEKPSRERANPTILINTKLHSDTTLRIREHVFAVRDTLDGPITVTLNEGKILLAGPSIPVASDMEKDEKG